MVRMLERLAFVALVPLALSACGGNGGSTASTTAPPTAAAAFQTKFGTPVAADYNASMNSEPVDPAASDVPALNLSAEPLDN